MANNLSDPPNRTKCGNDLIDMARPEPFSRSDCDQVREHLSAALDGEWHTSEDITTALRTHLDGCAGCRNWQQLLVVTTRKVRVHEAGTVPDLSSVIINRLIESQRQATHMRRASPLPMLRLALGTISIGLIVGALTNLVHTADSFSSGHLPRELGGFELALGVGFLFAALRPRHAPGIAIVGAIVGSLLGLTTLWDVLAGTTTSGIEAHHLLDIAGAAVSVAVARLSTGMANPQEFGTLRASMGTATSAR